MSKKKEKRDGSGKVNRNGYSTPTAKDLASKAAPRGRNRGRGR